MEQLAKEIDALLDRHQIPSCSVAVCDAQGLVLQQAFGDNCSVDSQFHLFSGSKLYTAAAILRLVQDGKLALDDAATRYLPEKYKEPLQGITIEHLLGHASGLKDTPMQAWLSATFRPNNRPSLLECLEKFSLQRTNNSPREGSASYVNLNFVLSGCIIEQVSGKSYEQYVAATVLKPLGSQAVFSYQESQQLVTGYVGYWNSLITKFLLARDQYVALYEGSRPITKGSRGAGLYSLSDFDTDAASIGGLIGTAKDFIPFLIEFIRCKGGPTTDKATTILSVENLANMVQKHFDGSIGVHSRDGVGLAWKIGKDFVNHEGGGPGFTTETRCYLEDGIGIVVLTNKWSINFGEGTVCHEICEMIRKAVIAARIEG